MIAILLAAATFSKLDRVRRLMLDHFLALAIAAVVWIYAMAAVQVPIYLRDYGLQQVMGALRIFYRITDLTYLALPTVLAIVLLSAAPRLPTPADRGRDPGQAHDCVAVSGKCCLYHVDAVLSLRVAKR